MTRFSPTSPPSTSIASWPASATATPAATTHGSSLALARTAAERYGAVVATRAAVTGIAHDDRWRARAAPRSSRRAPVDDPPSPSSVRARVLVNATGVWADEVTSIDEGRAVRSITPAKGVHVTVPAVAAAVPTAAVLPVPATDAASSSCPGRTPPTPTSGRPTPPTTGPLDEPLCRPDDVDYLLGAVNALDVGEPHARRRHRCVGGTAPAARRRRRAPPLRAHRGPLASTPGAHRRGRRRPRHRRQVDDLPAHGRAHRRRRRRAAARHAEVPHGVAPAPRRAHQHRAHGGARDRPRALATPRPPLRHGSRRGRRGRRAGPVARSSRSARHSPTSAPSSSSRRATSSPSPCRPPLPAHARAPARRPRDVRRAPSAPRASSPASSDGTRRASTTRSPTYRSRCTRELDAAGVLGTDARSGERRSSRARLPTRPGHATVDEPRRPARDSTPLLTAASTPRASRGTTTTRRSTTTRGTGGRSRSAGPRTASCSRGPALVVAPTSTAEVAAVRRGVRRARRAGHAPGRSIRRVRRRGARAGRGRPRPHGAHWRPRVRRDVAAGPRRRPAPSGRTSSVAARRAAARSGTSPSRSSSRRSAAGSPAEAPASTRRATARSRTSCAASPSCSPDGTVVTTGGAGPRQAVGPDLTQLFVGLGGHARGHHARSSSSCTACRRRRRARLRRSRPSPTASTRAVACCNAVRRPPCSASTTSWSPHRHFEVDRCVLVVLDEADEAHPSTRRWRSSTRSARPHGARTTRSSTRWLEHRNDVGALGTALGARRRRRHDRDRRAVVRARPRAPRRDRGHPRRRGHRGRHGAPVARLPRRRVPVLHLRGPHRATPTATTAAVWDAATARGARRWRVAQPPSRRRAQPRALRARGARRTAPTCSRRSSARSTPASCSTRRSSVVAAGGR